MKVNLPKDIDLCELINPREMQTGKVYRFTHLLASATPCEGVIAIDTNDSDVLTFNSTHEFEDWLEGENLGIGGELTPYVMQISLV